MRRYIPLNNLGADQAKFVVCNEPHKFGTPGFKLDARPRYLPIEESQFGDFANYVQRINHRLGASREEVDQRTSLAMNSPHQSMDSDRSI